MQEIGERKEERERERERERSLPPTSGAFSSFPALVSFKIVQKIFRQIFEGKKFDHFQSAQKRDV